MRKETPMTYRGYIKNGQVTLEKPARLPEGAQVTVEIVEQSSRVSRPKRREKLRPFNPIHMPGESLADELVRNRR
jgi:hypothetical protein